MRSSLRCRALGEPLLGTGRRFEKLNRRDATYVRIQYESGAAGDVVGAFAHINYFVHDDGRKYRTPANMCVTYTVSVDVQPIRDAALVRGAARGRGRGAGVGASASGARGRERGASALRASASPQAVPPQNAVLFKVLPGRETVVVGVDAIVALEGIVHCGQDGYLVRRVVVSTRCTATVNFVHQKICEGPESAICTF